MYFLTCKQNKGLKDLKVNFDSKTISFKDTSTGFHGELELNPNNIIVEGFIHDIFPEKVMLFVEGCHDKNNPYIKYDFDIIVSLDENKQDFFNFISEHKNDIKVKPSIYQIKNLKKDKLQVLDMIKNCISTNKLRDKLMLKIKNCFYNQEYKKYLDYCRKNNVDLDMADMKKNMFDKINSKYGEIISYQDNKSVISNMGKYFGCSIKCEDLRELYTFVEKLYSDFPEEGENFGAETEK